MSAYTLVEILVTIAILAALAGLLVPALEGALAEGGVARCVSNERQQYYALYAYANEWEQYCPSIPSDGGGGCRASPAAIAGSRYQGVGVLIGLGYTTWDTFAEPAVHVGDPNALPANRNAGDGRYFELYPNRPANRFPEDTGPGTVATAYTWYCPWFIDYRPTKGWGAVGMEEIRRRIDRRPRSITDEPRVLRAPVTTAYFMCYQAAPKSTEGNGSHGRKQVNAVFDDGHVKTFATAGYAQHPTTHKGCSTRYSTAHLDIWWQWVMWEDQK